MTEQFKTLTEVTDYYAASTPEKLVYEFLSNQGIDSITFGELAEQAKTFAAFLQKHGKVGERVLLLYPPGINFIVAFLGCLYAGMIAVPIHPPINAYMAGKLENILKDCQPQLILSDRDTATQLAKVLIAKDINMITDWLAIKLGHFLDENPPETISIDQKTTWLNPKAQTIQSYRGAYQLIHITDSAIAFLQYTSGSTGDPKGVILTHSNLIDNQKIIKRGVAVESTDRFASWLPPYHDMGLIGTIMQPLYSGASACLFAPLDFIKRPLKWLQIISDYQATIAGGPNFAFRICAEKLREQPQQSFDLSSLRVVFSGAEPIDWNTSREFIALCQPYGLNEEAFTPCYGLAEATLMVSVSRDFKEIKISETALANKKIVLISDEVSEGKRIVSCGESLQEVVIVDPETQIAVESNEVGEIWINSPSVAIGYWQNPQLTQEIFHAKLPDSDKTYLRTGDLGFFNNNELFVTGRLKEIIIIHGANYYPQDLEQIVRESDPELSRALCAAFPYEVDGVEQLALAIEFSNQIEEARIPQICSDVTQELLAKRGLAVHAIVGLAAKQIPRTTSGKLRRHCCKQFLIDSTLARYVWSSVPLDSAHSPGTAPTQIPKTEPNSKKFENKLYDKNDTRTFLIQLIADQLKIAADKVKLSNSFADYGFNSIKFTELAGKIEQELNIEISPVIFYQYTTIEEIIDALSGDMKGDNNRVSIAKANQAAQEKSLNEDIAIVAIACRFPGNINNTDEFWEFLVNQKDAISEVPAERWLSQFYYDSEPMKPGKIITNKGGFLNNVAEFSAEFFGISPLEAENLDPQQRLMLEMVWQGLENAGIPASELKGTRTGVFVGATNNDYGQLIKAHSDSVNAYWGTGNALSAIAGRISYLFGFKGPSIVVDTACSSSLVAVHQACQSLRTGECNIAIAGGINLILSPDVSISLSQAKMLSADGHCKTFSADANGYVRSEGCAVVILKRLKEAEAAHDNILGVIKASAINHDGLSNGFAAPSVSSQADVIQQCLAKAQLEPSQISFLECHGTGTALGDPIEFKALKEVFAMSSRSLDNPLWLGAVKTNLGHLEAAAGMAGLIKAALVLHEREIPANIHFTELNPLIDLGAIPAQLPYEITPMTFSNNQSYAGVSSFGFTGTNAHILLTNYSPPNKENKLMGNGTHLLTISAKSAKSVSHQINQYVSHLETATAYDLHNIACTSQIGRDHFSVRTAILARSSDEFIQKIKDQDYVIHHTPQTPHKLAFMFTGEGSCYSGMGKELYEHELTFRASLDECATIAEQLIDINLLKLLWDKEYESLLMQTQYAQLATFALEYALYQLWYNYGVKPDAVIGHGLGEYVAACACGILSLKDAIQLVTCRGRLMQNTAEGQMYTLTISEDDLLNLIYSHPIKVDIAAINSPYQCVVSVAQTSEDALIKLCEEQKISYKRLPINRGFHSHLMDPILEAFYKETEKFTYHKPHTPFISNLSGKPIKENTITAAYWARHLREKVNFHAGVKSLTDDGCHIFLEIGVHPTLTNVIKASVKNDAQHFTWLHSLQKKVSERESMLNALSELYQAGVNVNWHLYHKNATYQKVVLPNYVWEKTRYWFVSNKTCQHHQHQEFQHQQIQQQQQPVQQQQHLHQLPVNHSVENSTADLAPLNTDPFVTEFNAADISAKPQLLTQKIKTIIHKVTKISVDYLDKDRPLMEIGVDSLMLVHIHNSLNKCLPDLRHADHVELFSQPSLTIAKLVDQIMNVLFPSSRTLVKG